MRRTCAICAGQLEDGQLRSSSRSKITNAILVASLTAFCSASVSSARCSYEACCSQRKTVCHRHFVEAAQNMCSEMALMGKRYTPLSGQAVGAYVTVVDIPVHLVELLNANVKNMGIDVEISCKDVWNFLNDVLRRYYGTPLWKQEQEMNTSQTETEELFHSVDQKYLVNLDQKYLVNHAEEKANIAIIDEEVEDIKNVICHDYESDVVSEASVNTNCSGSVPDCDLGLLGSPTYLLKKIKKTHSNALCQSYLVEGELLLELFKFCPECGSNLKGVRLVAVDTVAVVNYVCSSCQPCTKIRQWESQQKTVPHESEQTYKSNVAASVAALTTGVPLLDLQKWGKQLSLQLPPKSFFWKVVDCARPAIERVFLAHQVPVFEEIKFQYEGCEGLHLTADGAYWSTEEWPLMGNVVLADGRSRLVLHNEVLLRSHKGKSGSIVEIEGFRRSLETLTTAGFSVVSLTTNGNPSVRKLRQQVEKFAGSIRHFSPGSHLLKWFEGELQKAAGYNGCEQIEAWVKRLRNHLWRSIKYGMNNRSEAVPVFNTCLMHVRGVHKWPQVKLTGPYTKCFHDPVSRPCHESLMLKAEAMQRFENVVLTESFQRNLANASPYGDDTIYDVRKAIDRFYYRKKMLYPSWIFPLFSTLATMHVNAWRMAEIKRKRNSERKRKKSRRRARNSPTKQTWRRSVFDEVLKERLLALEGKADLSESEYVRELVAAEESYESEIL